MSDSITTTSATDVTNTIGSLKTFEFSPINWVIIGLYLFGILVMGLFFQFQRKKSNLQVSSQEYFKASGSVPGWAVGLSVFSTSLSAITFVSVPETTFTSDWGVVIGAMLIPLAAPFIIKYVIPFYRQLSSNTAYGYLQKRYNHSCQMIVSIFYLFYHTIRIGVVTYLPTIVISSVLPEANPYIIAFVISAIAIVSTLYGGTRGVIWTNVVQAIFLTAGILILCFFAIGNISNLPGANQNTFGQTATFAFDAGKYVAANRWVLTFSGLGIPMILMTYLVNVLYSMVCGHDIVQRYQSSKRLSETKKALYLNSCMFIITFFMFYGLGTLIFQLLTSPYSVGAASGFGVPKFGTVNGNGFIAMAAGTDPSTLNMSEIGYSNPTGIISNFTNFIGVKNQFIEPSGIMYGNQNLGLIKTTAIVPYFIVTALPIGVSGIVIAGIMAVAQGTNSSGMTSGSEVFIRDILLVHKPGLTQKQQVFIGKVVIVVMGTLGYGVSVLLIAGGITQVYLFFNSLQGIFGAPVLAAFLMGMFGTYVKKNAMTFGLYFGHAFAIAIFILADNNVAALAGWNDGKGFFNNQWDGVFAFAFVISITLIYQFFENVIKYKNSFFIDNQFMESIDNLSWANVSKEHQLISQAELSVSWDERAYAKYVKSFYRDKKNSNDPLVLEKSLVNYKEFVKISSYERYLNNSKTRNNWKTLLFKNIILNEQDFNKYRLEYLNRELERKNISEDYIKVFE